MDIVSLILTITAIINLFFGFVVYFKKRREVISKIFLGITLGTAIWLSGLLIMMKMDQSFALLGGRLAFAGAAVIPYFFLLFSIEFPRHDKSKSNIFLVILFIIGLGLFFLSLFTQAVVAGEVKKVGQFGFTANFGSLYKYFGVYFVVFVFWGGLNFIKKLKTTIDQTEKKQIKIFLLGSILSLSIGAMLNLILPLVFDIHGYSQLGPFATIFFVFFTALAITKYHLFGIKVILTELLVGVIGIGLLIQLFLAPTVLGKVINVIFFILFCVFGYYLIKATREESKQREEAEKIAVREKALRDNAEKLAQKERQQREESERFKMVSNELKVKLSQTLELKHIISSIAEVIFQNFKIQKISFALKQPTSEFYVLWNTIGFQEKEIASLVKDTFLCPYVESKKRILIESELFSIIEKTDDEIERAKLKIVLEQLKRNGIALLLPLFQKEMLIGIIFLGEKTRENQYTDKDIKLLEALSYQISISINNSLLYQEIKKDKEMLEKFYKLTIGREVKMVELKNKIKELEEKLGGKS